MLALAPTQHIILPPNTCAAVYEACTYTESTHFFFRHPFLTWMYSSDASEDSSVEEEEQQHQHIRKMMFAAAFTVTNIVATAALIYANPLYNKVPYHTSALSGADWVRELLGGHPERIRSELGEHKEVFHDLIAALQKGGLKSSKH